MTSELPLTCLRRHVSLAEMPHDQKARWSDIQPSLIAASTVNQRDGVWMCVLASTGIQVRASRHESWKTTIHDAEDFPGSSDRALSGNFVATILIPFHVYCARLKMGPMFIQWSVKHLFWTSEERKTNHKISSSTVGGILLLSHPITQRVTIMDSPLELIRNLM